MKGNRKFWGFIVATIAAIAGLVAGAIEPGLVKVLPTYWLAGAALAGGFFGFNGLEHWAERKPSA